MGSSSEDEGDDSSEDGSDDNSGSEDNAVQTKYFIDKDGSEPVLMSRRGEAAAEQVAVGVTAIRKKALRMWRGRMKTMQRKMRWLQEDMHNIGIECELSLLFKPPRGKIGAFLSDFVAGDCRVVKAAGDFMRVVMGTKLSVNASKELVQVCALI